ncbi:ras-related protein Rab-15 isoform X2 [Panthera tigris]|uniref:ras-related protein Rab-15 isoform X2 n=1 Tax=Panthera leo TaxID=9689 RepID=UPI000766284D|nr:ras-related protein Rab-15 isoform X2 [Panthera leo]XP_042799447.1 ras-related protein Rab-15 isoform X2 [Panthera leo]XP_042799448.1 ras-related protein Rab-15 isoform X2 [Panthera leo]XP_042799449.1 ras-related protein Rab-15 isoform X2 [Panthera leo]XP_042845840.1 ras-related protein Rab-15 isoform X2 [Panthera tigris]XP_042845841.1 ras-related protein Rab-15 isoform X2 [Panthera tigris]XP_042845842.1 ras-related protein Rab-15 isoform X2 [Panthera tigris]XP_042845843.1 ras-related pro
MRERPPTMRTTSYYVHVLHIHCLIRIPQQLLGGQWYCHSTVSSCPAEPGTHSSRTYRETSVDFKMKTIEVDGIKVRIQIWDTAGQERYQTITKQYYRRAQGIFLVYDISSERSYQHIMKWVSDVDEYAPEGVQKILIGNKADEEQKRQVGREQGQQLAKEYGMDFYETSACTNLNIKESFTRLTELVLQAHRKELDGLRTRASNELALAELEEDEGKPEGPANSSKTCWC